MNTDAPKDQSKQEFISILADIPNIWAATSVKAEPQKWLQNWQVFKVVRAESFPEAYGYHFVGYDIRGCHGAVSSKVVQFDPIRMCGITQSGRVYQLVGMPGVDPDGQYTFQGWTQGNRVVVEDATQEFIQHYRIDMEHVREMDKR